MAAQFEEKMLNTLPAKHRPMVRQLTRFLTVSGECTRALHAIYPTVAQYQALYDTLTIESKTNATYLGTIPSHKDANGCKEFYRKCDAVLALPSTGARNIILKYLTTVAGSQFLMDQLSLSRTVDLVGVDGLDKLKRREEASEHSEIVSSKKRHKAAASGRAEGRWDVVGSNILYRDRETRQVLEASVIDAGSSVV